MKSFGLALKLAAMGLRGPRPRGAAYHIMRGNYRPSVHGPRPEPAATPEEAWRREAWRTLLRLPGGPPAPRELDPIEELLRRGEDEKRGE